MSGDPVAVTLLTLHDRRHDKSVPLDHRKRFRMMVDPRPIPARSHYALLDKVTPDIYVFDSRKARREWRDLMRTYNPSWSFWWGYLR